MGDPKNLALRRVLRRCPPRRDGHVSDGRAAARASAADPWTRGLEHGVTRRSRPSTPSPNRCRGGALEKVGKRRSAGHATERHGGRPERHRQGVGECWAVTRKGLGRLTDLQAARGARDRRVDEDRGLATHAPLASTRRGRSDRRDGALSHRRAVRSQHGRRGSRPGSRGWRGGRRNRRRRAATTPRGLPRMALAVLTAGDRSGSGTRRDAGFGFLTRRGGGRRERRPPPRRSPVPATLTPLIALGAARCRHY